MRIVHAYPGASPHSLEIAQALQERGWLECDFTTLAFLPNHPLDASLMAFVTTFGWSRIQKVVLRRCHEMPFGGCVARYPWWDLARVTADRLQLGAVAKDRLWERGSTAYDRWVSRKLHSRIDAVIGYEHSCLHTFRRARELGIRTIYNMNAPHPAVSDRLVSKATPRDLASQRPGAAYFNRIFRRRLAHKEREFAIADYVIANSQFAAETLQSQGFPSDRIAVVLLGAPKPAKFRARPLARTKMIFLYAGRVAPHKGCHLLLKAWELSKPPNSELWFAGDWDLPALPVSLSALGVKLLGRLSWEDLYARYEMADLLVFPSLCDGFGAVVTEALAHGLPVLTTFAAGAAQFIREGENGFVIPPGDVAALAKALADCAKAPNRVRRLRRAARVTASARPWTVFRREYTNVLLQLLRRPWPSGSVSSRVDTSPARHEC